MLRLVPRSAVQRPRDFYPTGSCVIAVVSSLTLRRKISPQKMFWDTSVCRGSSGLVGVEQTVRPVGLEMSKPREPALTPSPTSHILVARTLCNHRSIKQSLLSPSIYGSCQACTTAFKTTERCLWMIFATERFRLCGRYGS